jgi:phosphoglycerate dehydrogenase-like enzyme
MKPELFFPISADAQKLYWPDEVVDRLGRIAALVMPDPDAEPWDRCGPDTRAIVVGWGAPQLPESVWSRLSGLIAVGIFGGSASYIESPTDLLRTGVTLSNASPEMGEGVAETTLALMLASQYDLVNSASAFRETGRLDYDVDRVNRSLAGSTVGLIGFGYIGRMVAALLRPLGTSILVHDPYADVAKQGFPDCRQTDLNSLLKKSDVVSLHAGWTKETEGMLGPDRLDLLKPGALVVSTARMPIFVQEALAERVLAGRLRFASDFIPFDRTIWSRPEMMACPGLIAVHGHTSVTGRTVRRMAERVATDLERIFSGEEPENRVTEEWISRTT